MTEETLLAPDGSHKFWNLFMPGCRLGTYHFEKYNKNYVYVQMPESKCKIFLRCVIFLTIKGTDKPDEFAIVHRFNKKLGGPTDKNNWEPIKGQVEDKERRAGQRLAGKEHDALLNEVLRYTIYREVEEEAKIHPCSISNLKFHPEIAYTSRHGNYPEAGMHFQYMFFTGEISRKDFEVAQAKVHDMYLDPRTMNLRKDEREKNGLSLWSKRKGASALMGGPAGAMVRLYMRNFG